METIAQIFANKFNIVLSGRPSIYKQSGLTSVVWIGDGWQFTFYSNGVWDIQFDDGRTGEGRTTPPGRKTWVLRLIKRYGLGVPQAISAVSEWRK